MDIAEATIGPPGYKIPRHDPHTEETIASTVAGEVFAEMAEVALLVVEDYERRTRRGATGLAGKGERGSEMEQPLRSLAPFAVLLALGRQARETADAAPMGAEQRAAEPRSSIGLAAIDGFFSA